MVQTAFAQREIDDFKEQFGEPHLALACHAAFPLVSNPDLLYRLWANFPRDVHGAVLGIPWIAVADLLLSSLCEEIGYETYRMADPVRNLLLQRLHKDRRFRSKGRDRLLELGGFLRQYVQNDLSSPQQSAREVAEAQRWTADAYTHPQALVQSIDEAFGDLQSTDRPKYLRLAALLQTFNMPLSGWARPDDATFERFETLVVYSQGMASLLRGNEAAAKQQLGQVVGKTDLPMPDGILPEQEKKPAPLSRRELIRAMRQQTELQPKGGEGILDQIRQGRCVPVIGGWLDFEVGVGVSEEHLRAAYAEVIQYPFSAPYRLEQLIEYQRTVTGRDRLGVAKDFLDFVATVIYGTAKKALFSPDMLPEDKALSGAKDITQFANFLGYPRFEQQDKDPLLLLANLPVPLYVTTSYFRFLENALMHAGRVPRSEFYRSEEEASLPSDLDPNYTPSVSAPLVYHMFGVDTEPSTLVLSEDDYLRYLMEVTKTPELIPAVVRGSIASSSLLFIEHDLHDLRWRVLDHAIRQSRSARLRLDVVFQMKRLSEEQEALIRPFLRQSGLVPFWGPLDGLLIQVSS